MTTDEIEVRHVPERHRFEILLGGERAGLSTYRDADGRRVFIHTEIDSAREGQGLGGKLIRAALDATRADGLTVEPQCPFVRSFIDRHPDYADLVAA
jgi:predicted GNAT family acetyltransferase